MVQVMHTDPARPSKTLAALTLNCIGYLCT